MAGGSAGPCSLLRQVPWLLQKCCCAVHAGSLMDDSFLYNWKGLATRYAPGPPPGKASAPFAFQDVGVLRRVCHFSSSSTGVFARGIDSSGGGRRPLQIESVATRFRSRGLHGGFNNEEVAGGSEGSRCA